ncbi:MAG: DUF2842 domain-containing protein [Aestuariivirgaceae bacterium]
MLGKLGRLMGLSMKIRARKLLGTLAAVSFLTVYCLLAMVIGNAVVLRYGGLGQAVYFVIAGLAWLPPAMLLVRWMQRPDSE